MYVYIHICVRTHIQIHIFVRLIWNILVKSLGVQEVSLQGQDASIDFLHFLPVNKNRIWFGEHNTMPWYYRTISWLLWDLRGYLSQRQETLLTPLTNIQALQIFCAQWHSIHQQVKLFRFSILTAPLGTATFPERAVKVTRTVISDYFSIPYFSTFRTLLSCIHWPLNFQ